MDMMEFVKLETGELITVVVLAIAVVAVAIAARRAQQQAPAPPGEVARDGQAQDGAKRRVRAERRDT
jgi:hypothetical protein